MFEQLLKSSQIQVQPVMQQMLNQQMPATQEESLEWCQRRSKELSEQLRAVQQMQRQLQTQLGAQGQQKPQQPTGGKQCTQGLGLHSSSDDTSSGGERLNDFRNQSCNGGGTRGSNRAAQRAGKDFQPPAHTDGPPNQDQTMKAQLQALHNEDPRCVFVVRRINKLGFESADTLREYFSQYGEVKVVHVSHSRVKSVAASGSVHWRMRAAALGFIVMAAADSTTRLLADGPEHPISGSRVRVNAFAASKDEEEEEMYNKNDETNSDEQGSNSKEDTEEK